MVARRKLFLSLATLGAAGALAAVTKGRDQLQSRWEARPDPTGGALLDLPPGREVAVPGTDGAVLAALVAGDESAPTVVLGHGWTGDRRVWGPVARLLVAKGYRVVVYDQRGHGGSRAGRDGMTIESIGDDVRAVLEHLDLTDVVLGGHSMGGMAVQSFAARHPEVLTARVRHVALISTAAGNLVRRPQFAGRIAATHPAAQRLLAGDKIGPLVVRVGVGRRPVWSHLVATRDMYVATPPMTRGDFFGAMSRMDLVAGLAHLTVPTTVVVGSLDRLTPRRHAELLVRTIPGARLVVIEGAGHQLPFEAPERVSEILAGS